MRAAAEDGLLSCAQVLRRVQRCPGLPLAPLALEYAALVCSVKRVSFGVLWSAILERLALRDFEFATFILLVGLDAVLQLAEAFSHVAAQPNPENHEVARVGTEEDNENVAVVAVDIGSHDLVDLVDEGTVVVSFLPDHDEHVAILRAPVNWDVHGDASLDDVVLFGKRIIRLACIVGVLI